MSAQPQIPRGTVAILLFHGVIRERRSGVRNYTSKHMTQDRFVDVLRALLAQATPVPMPDLVEVIGGRLAPPECGFAVTFDDGFENNCSIAAPILRDFSVPATFYVTTGFIDENGSSWIDRIEATVEGADHIQLDDEELGICGTFETHAERIVLLDRIRQIIKGAPTLDPYATAERVIASINPSAPAPWDPELDAKMSWNQIRELNSDALFTIGGHGRTHRILEFLDDDALEGEVAHSTKRLTEELGRAVEHYSYPEGLQNCYSDRVIRTLQRHGIICAPTAQSGVVRPGDDPFRLKRIPMV